MSYAAICPTVNVATADEAALILRKKIGLRLKGGPHGLMRCWLQFRERAGGSKEGITYEEFVRGLSKYDLILDESVSGELFDRMDDSGDGHIQIKEFIDNVMGRWPADTNTIIDNHVQQGRNKGVNDQPLEMNADEALIALRKKIGLRLKGGPHGLMRCWVQFREKAGGTKEGITYDEFHRGLINYGLHLKESVSREMYNRMDSSGDGHIQITEFVDNVMGRWPADTNSIVDSHVKVGTGKNVFDAPLRLNAEEALGSLRRKIGQRLKGGPYGLQRCWMQFRERCGGSKEGIAYEEWCRGLKLYDLILDESVSRELFNRMDQNGDGSIHMREVRRGERRRRGGGRVGDGEWHEATALVPAQRVSSTLLPTPTPPLLRSCRPSLSSRVAVCRQRHGPLVSGHHLAPRASPENDAPAIATARFGSHGHGWASAAAPGHRHAGGHEAAHEETWPVDDAGVEEDRIRSDDQHKP